MDFLKILILSLASFVILFIIAKILGYRQISQMSFFDYIVGITIGSVAAEMSTNIDIEAWKGITSMVVYLILCLVLDFISQKSNSARKAINGTPIVLMRKGKIIEESLKKAKIETDELMTAARVAGYFNLSDVDTAIMETTGEVSFLPMPLQRPLNPKDFNFAPMRTGICIPVILDGQVQKDNLQKVNITETKLKKILSERALQAEKILLATMDEAGNFDAFEK